MGMRTLKLLVLAVVLGVAAGVLALDPPHDGSFSTSVTECQTCHKLHAPAGGTYQRWTTNDAGCLTCHDGVVRADNNFFKPDAWSSGTQAVPGTGGIHHNWTAAPGTQAPTNPAMAGSLTTDGKLQCATCHDVHGTKDAAGMPIQDTMAERSAFSSYPLGVAMPTNNSLAGLLKVVSLYEWDFPFARTYTLRVVDASHVEITDNSGSVVTVSFTVGDAPANNVPIPQDDNVMVRITSAPATTGVRLPVSGGRSRSPAPSAMPTVWSGARPALVR